MTRMLRADGFGRVRAGWMSGAAGRHAAVVGVALGLAACGSSAGRGALPNQAEGLVPVFNLLDVLHLADVRGESLFVDFGTPARAKYTMGGWKSGWGSDGKEGEVTFTRVGDLGRIYLPLEEPRDLTLRLSLRPTGARRMLLFFNNKPLPGVVFEGEGGFRVYDVAVPAALTRAGENYFLLRLFGGAARVDGRSVSAEVASLEVFTGSPGPTPSTPPTAPLRSFAAEQGSVGGVERPSLALDRPLTLSFYLEVPPRAQLVFGVGTESKEHKASLEISVTRDGTDSATLFSTHAPGGRWSDHSVDLAGYAGQAVRLDVKGAAEPSGRFLWSVPALMTPPGEPAKRPAAVRNVIVLLIDTLRADRLKPYNPRSRVETPVFDRLAREGVLFARAQSPENWTKPSCASVLTGLTPMTHGAKTSEAALSRAAEMVSETFHAAKFATGSFIANGYVSDRFGFDQGWDHYRNFIREGKPTEAENVFKTAGDWIEKNRDKRFFAYIQTIDPHVPYDPPAELVQKYDPRPYAGPVQPRKTPTLLERAKQKRVTFSESDQRRLEALHDGEITYHDRQLGRFLARLAELGVRDDTLLVITSDHGEEFRDHGSWGHGHSIFQELLGVPLLFHLPGGLPARRVEHPVSTLNIAQTVLDLSGVSGLSRAEGRSLVPDLLGATPVGPQAAFSDWQDIRRVVRLGSYKLVARASRSILFDLGQDPVEKNDLKPRDRPVAGRLARILLGQYLGASHRGHWSQALQPEAAPLRSEDAQMDATIRAQLKALGY